MKKISAQLLAAAIALILTACGSGGNPGQETSEQTDPVQETSRQDSVSETTEASSDAAENAGSSMEQSPEAGAVSSEEDLTFPLGTAVSGNFTGNVYFAAMIQNDDTYHFPQTNHLTFAPGARSYWHSHGGMILLGTGGVGYYQEEGKPAQIIREGDVVECPEGVRHWHGAAPDSWFSQIVIYDAEYTPEHNLSEDPVTDEHYDNLEVASYTPQNSQDSEFMFHQGENPLSSDTFSGPYYLTSLIGSDNVAGSPELHYVVFEPGTINNWHTHEGGQILIATDGVGYHQIEGEPVQVLHPGDVAYCPPGETHWHGPRIPEPSCLIK